MTSQDYQQGMVVLSASGLLIDLQPETIGIWEALLIDLDAGYFKKAIISICKETEKLYPGDNIIAMIREKSKSLHQRDVTRERRAADTKKQELWKLEAEKSHKLLKEKKEKDRADPIKQAKIDKTYEETRKACFKALTKHSTGNASNCVASLSPITDVVGEILFNEK